MNGIMETATEQPFYESSEKELTALMSQWAPGQKWEYRNQWTQGRWVDHPSGKPGWFFDTQYRLKVEQNDE